LDRELGLESGVASLESRESWSRSLESESPGSHARYNRKLGLLDSRLRTRSFLLARFRPRFEQLALEHLSLVGFVGENEAAKPKPKERQSNEAEQRPDEQSTSVEIATDKQ